MPPYRSPYQKLQIDRKRNESLPTSTISGPRMKTSRLCDIPTVPWHLTIFWIITSYLIHTYSYFYYYLCVYWILYSSWCQPIQIGVNKRIFILFILYSNSYLNSHETVYLNAQLEWLWIHNLTFSPELESGLLNLRIKKC